MLSLIRGFQQVFPQKISNEEVHSFLEASQSIGEFIKEKELGSYHYLLVVDQFEELFTGPSSIRKKKKNGRNPESRQFIENLVNAFEDQETGIHVMLSIRSDFLNVCTSYRLLTDQINKSKYLLPQMNREALSEAITEPIHQSGATVAPGFEKYLLDELEGVNPPLPFLQFALHHTWNHWVERGEPDQPISLEDFKFTGALKETWTRQLEEAYDALEYSQKRICERMFKAIAFRTESQEYICWHSSLDNIARIAQCTVDDAIEVAEIFRCTGGPILCPHSAVTLNPYSMVELSHECLITIWERLQQWVDEEAESILMYLKLSEAAFNYQQGRVELWKPPELQEAVAWRDLQEPNPAWGAQFDPAFERTLVFLSTSVEEYNSNEERKVVLLKRRRLMTRSIAIVVGLAAVVVLLVFLLSRSETDGLDQRDNRAVIDSRQNNRAVPETPSYDRNSEQQLAEQNDNNQQTGRAVESGMVEENNPVIEQEEPANEISQQVAENETLNDAAQGETPVTDGQERIPDNPANTPANTRYKYYRKPQGT